MAPTNISFLDTTEELTNCKSYFIGKANSVQEACGKCFAVHLLKFEILQTTWEKWNKEHQTLSFQYFTNKSSLLVFFVLFFHVVCKISNFNKWTSWHLAQASCTELTLFVKINSIDFYPSLTDEDIIFECFVHPYYFLVEKKPSFLPKTNYWCFKYLIMN